MDQRTAGTVDSIHTRNLKVECGACELSPEEMGHLAVAWRNVWPFLGTFPIIGF